MTALAKKFALLFRFYYFIDSLNFSYINLITRLIQSIFITPVTFTYYLLAKQYLTTAAFLSCLKASHLFRYLTLPTLY